MTCAHAAPSVHDIVQHMLGVLPDLDEHDQRLSLSLYLELAHGAPVPLSLLARRLGTSVDEVERRLADWPGVYRDKQRHIIGYWGLTIVPTRHKLRIGGRDLYTWCAWDTLFIPALLRAGAQVRSACRDTNTPVRLTIGPDALEAASPENLWISFVLPSADSMRRDMVASFCRNVHFLATPGLDGSHPGLPPSAFVLTLGEAFEVGRARNQARYRAVTDL
ncbi:MAG: organomercurial lyase [Burkholderiales bacterium]